MSALLAADLPYWVQSLLRVLGGVVAVLLPAGAIVYLFLFKMMSFMQSRLGPMEAGPYGSMQLFAEVGKWLQKEDITPERADRVIFKIAPLVVLASTFLLVAVVPFGPDAWFTNFEAGVFYMLAVSSVSVLGILIAGWSSANKYSLLGGLRAAGQLIAYELPMVLAVIGVIIQAGTMNLQGIVLAQNTGEMFGWNGLGNPYILTQFTGFIIFMIAVQAELTQTPFDMPIAESELVSGHDRTHNMHDVQLSSCNAITPRARNGGASFSCGYCTVLAPSRAVRLRVFSVTPRPLRRPGILGIRGPPSRSR